MKKRMLSMALALCMLLGMLPATSFAEARGAAVPYGPIDPWDEPIVYGDNGYTIWFWRYSREIDRVDGGSETETELTIPAEIQGFPVSIIRMGAFSSCGYLQTVNIPHSIEDMTYAFDYCQSLVNINVDAENPVYASVDGILFDKEKTELIRYPAGRPAASYTIPSGVTSIGTYAFKGCSSLTSVTIPNGVKYIGWAAFKDCTGLTSVSLPASVTGLDNRAFEDCALTAINVAADNEHYASVDGVLFNKEKTKLIRYPTGKAGNSYTIPDSVTSIGEWAFEGCSSLTSVTIPDGVTSIGEYAFRSCSSLKNITIPSGVTSIEWSVFGDCKSLPSINIPRGVTSIGTWAFSNCSNLKDVYYSGTPKQWKGISVGGSNEPLSAATIHYEGTDIVYLVTGGNIYFNKATGTVTGCDESVTAADIPAEIDGVAVTGIWNGAFRNCSSLTSVTIPDGVTSIGERAFEYCSSLTSVTIPNSVTSIGSSAFADCSSLKDVYYAGSQEQWKEIKIIGYDYSPLRNATIHYNSTGPTEVPYPVTGGNIYFDKTTGKVTDCDSSVTAAEIPAEIDGVAVTGIATAAFENCINLKRVSIPASVTELGFAVFQGCSNLTDISVASDSRTLSSKDGVLFDKHESTLICYPAGKTANAYEVPQYIGAISMSAFYGCTALTDIILPDGLKDIRAYAFYGCSNLQKIVLPDNLAFIWNSAFEGCSNLTSIDIPSKVSMISYRAFSNCSNLKDINVASANQTYTSVDGVLFDKAKTGLIKYPEGKAATSYTIPSGVTSIGVGERVFEGCSSLTNVIIPDSVTSIGNYAFADCSSLKDVYYAGSQEQWQEINIRNNNSPLRNATIHYNSTGPTEVPYPVTGGNIYFDKATGKVIGSDENVTAADIPAEIDGVAVTGIADSAFENRYRLGRVAIPEGVTSIGENAFASCGNLARLILPKSVEIIGSGAFYSCEGLLAYNSIVYYSGTEDDWAAIDIGNYNGMLINAKNIYYNCSGSINIQLADTMSSPLPINVVKMLRWQGMDHSISGEPRNRGYDPTNISCTLTIYEDAGESYPTPTMQYNDYNVAEVLRRLTEEAEYHKYLYQNGELAEVPLTIESSPLGGFFLKHGDEPQLYVSAQFGMQPHTWHALELVFTSLAPGCVKMTLDGREYAFITPGDVNLDGTMNALDWITIMRWTLVASGGEYPSPNDEGFTIKVNGTDYNLWVLLADMTDTETDNSKNSENWGAAVNAVDWTTIMQLTLQAWKGSEQSELSDRFAIVIEKTSEPRYSENGVPIPDGDIRRVNYLNAAGENVTAEYAPPQRGSFVAFDDILIDGVYEYVLNSDGTVYFLEKPNAVKGVTFGGKDARPIISPTQKNYGGMVASDDTWFFVREIVFPDGTWTPRYSVKKLSDFQLRDQSDNQLLTDASYAYTTDSSPLPIRRVLFGTLLLDREIMPGYPGQSGWLLATGSTYERTVGGEVHVMLDGIDESGAQVSLDLGVYENGDCGDYNKFDLIESGKLYAYDMLYATGISELFETPEGLCYQSSYGRSTFWTEASILAESSGVVQVRLDPENAQYLTPDAIHAPNTYDLHYDSKTVIVNVHTRNGEIVYDSGVDEIGRTAPYDLKVHKADDTYEYSEQEYTNAYALVHTNGYISYIIVDSSYGGSVGGDALELHEGCDCDKADVYAGNIYSNLTGGVQKVTNGWNRR